MAALKVAIEWEFPDIRDLAISKLEEMQLDAASKLMLALEYSLEAWFYPAFRELTLRPTPLTEAEEARLGLEASYKLSKCRERVLRAHLEDNPTNLDALIHDFICDTFGTRSSAAQPEVTAIVVVRWPRPRIENGNGYEELGLGEVVTVVSRADSPDKRWKVRRTNGEIVSKSRFIFLAN